MDYHEVEKQIEHVANELKEQDYDFMEVLDEQEDLEGQYDDLARDYENAQRVIDEQAKLIEEKDREVADAYAKVKQMEEEVTGKEKMIERLQGKFKRGRDQFENKENTAPVMV